MKIEIKELPQTHLHGMGMPMSLQENKTAELWRNFMPLLRNVSNRKGENLFSVNCYTEPIQLGNMAQPFIKWAAYEPNNNTLQNPSFDSLVLEGGLYAVFHYKGLSTDPSIFRYIFAEWLPQSGYQLDQRPHFEILGSKYMNNHPDSEEEIWIPIKSAN